MGSSLVSVLVINFNGKHLLGNCLSSLLESDYAELEIIVLDCASKDGSAEFVKQNFPTIKIIQFDKDPGADGAYVVGARTAKGDYIMLMNNDALVERDTIARMVEAAADGRSLVTPTELDWQGRTWFLSRGGAYPLAMPLYLVLRTLKKRFDTGEPFAISIACALMAKEKFLEIPPNEHVSFYEELEWCWRLRLCGVNLKVLDNARFLHKGAATAGQTAKAAYYSGRNNLAAHFECLRLYSLLLFIPPLTLYYLLKPVVYLSRRRPGYAKAFLSGMVSFFRDVRVFWHDRNIVQEKRQISDFCIVRDMINSCAFIQRSSHLTTREYISKILHSP